MILDPYSAHKSAQPLTYKKYSYNNKNKSEKVIIYQVS